MSEDETGFICPACFEEFSLHREVVKELARRDALSCVECGYDGMLGVEGTMHGERIRLAKATEPIREVFNETMEKIIEASKRMGRDL